MMTVSSLRPAKGHVVVQKEPTLTSKVHALAAAAAVVLSLVAAGCAKTVDAGQMEDDLAEQLAPQAGVEASEVTVDCPDDEDAEEGNEFDCTLTAPNGDEVTVNVTITNGGDSFEAVVPPQQFK
jgi:hypothetical protein